MIMDEKWTFIGRRWTNILLQNGPRLGSCPSCGRTLVHLRPLNVHFSSIAHNPTSCLFRFFRFSAFIKPTMIKTIRTSWDSWLIGLLCMLLLLPAITSVLDYTYLPVREFDEQAFSDFLDSRQGVLPLKMLKWRCQCAYGWIYWVTVGVPMHIVKHWFNSDALAIFWGRFYSVLTFVTSLGFTWSMAKKERLSALHAATIIVFVFSIPTLIANATRMHPDMLQYLLLTLTILFLTKDLLRYEANWKWAALILGLAIGVKFNSICAGILFLICLIRQWNFRAGLRAFGWVVGGFILATLPSIGHLYRDYGRALVRANMSNATNHFTTVEGLGFGTWTTIWSQYGVWIPVTAVIVGAAVWAAWREWKQPSRSSYALFGLALSVVMYLSIAIFARKDALWHHYMVPVAAGIGPMLIGIAASCREAGMETLYRWLPLLFLLGSIPQWPQTWQEWSHKVFFLQSVEMQEAERVVADFEAAVKASAASGHKGPFLVLYQRDVFFTTSPRRAIGIAVPPQVDGVEIVKKPLSGISLKTILEEHHPDFIFARASNPLVQEPLEKGLESIPMQDHDFVLLRRAPTRRLIHD